MNEGIESAEKHGCARGNLVRNHSSDSSTSPQITRKIMSDIQTCYLVRRSGALPQNLPPRIPLRRSRRRPRPDARRIIFKLRAEAGRAARSRSCRRPSRSSTSTCPAAARIRKCGIRSLSPRSNTAGRSARSRRRSPACSFSQYMQNTAKIADKITVVRSMTHGEAAHERGTHNMFTGYRPSPAIQLSVDGLGRLARARFAQQPAALRLHPERAE